MKKHRFILALALAATLLVGYAAAAGGDADDPLISLDFLKKTFSAQAEKRIDDAVEQADASALAEARQRWDAAVAKAEASAGADYAATWTEISLKRGDMLSGLTGLQVLPYAGEMTVQYSSGAVVDVTDGREIANGSALKAGHRYLVAEDTVAVFTVSSKTAVLSYCGGYHIACSEQPDYNAMASALRALSLFRGTDTAYADGADLEQTPTRIQAVIMLIRLLGEEETALACTTAHPFVDVPEWCEAYVAYAYEKGYSNGVGRDRYGREIFGPQMETSAQMYTEFVLRALGHSSTAVADISDALSRAERAGVLTAAEAAAMQSESFLRADVVYLSYYALAAETAEGGSLSRRLIRAGVFTAEDYRAAQALVTTMRL